MVSVGYVAEFVLSAYTEAWRAQLQLAAAKLQRALLPKHDWRSTLGSIFPKFLGEDWACWHVACAYGDMYS